VDGVAQLVGAGGLGRADVEGEVHAERLAFAAFIGEHAVVADLGQADQPDHVFIGHVRSSSIFLRLSTTEPFCAAHSAPATRIASTDAITSCTRTPQTPRSAMSAVTAAVARSRNRGSDSAPSLASSSPRNRLREAPMSTGYPSSVSSDIRASSCQLAAAFLAKPRQGTRTIWWSATPPA